MLFTDQELSRHYDSLKKKDMPSVSRILKDIAESFVPMSLTTVSAKGGEATWKIEKTRDIEILHEIVMIRLAPFLSYTVTPKIFQKDKGETINDLTVHYVKKLLAISIRRYHWQ